MAIAVSMRMFRGETPAGTAMLIPTKANPKELDAIIEHLERHEHRMTREH
jgi:hypothetical protein